MIAYLEGKIIAKDQKSLTLLTAGGIGYKINVSADTLTKIGERQAAALWTHLAVREDALLLFGFLSKGELQFFEILISVSGVGPKTALGVIGIASIETLKKAIGSGDTTYLNKVSGIGKKTAAKIVLELRDKLGALKEGPALKTEIDALEALATLGYSKEEAREALKKVKAESTEAKVKEALKMLSN
ncbi:MAG TPA: Holliday junction branch migration protein RuvA [Candidatus Paceibacterota bacterium]|nr:Holliday junction branch migration protein RuvA [Candidatus Paceibacterota bacterium]